MAGIGAEDGPIHLTYEFDLEIANRTKTDPIRYGRGHHPPLSTAMLLRYTWPLCGSPPDCSRFVVPGRAERPQRGRSGADTLWVGETHDRRGTRACDSHPSRTLATL